MRRFVLDIMNGMARKFTQTLIIVASVLGCIMLLGFGDLCYFCNARIPRNPTDQDLARQIAADIPIGSSMDQVRALLTGRQYASHGYTNLQSYVPPPNRSITVNAQGNAAFAGGAVTQKDGDLELARDALESRSHIPWKAVWGVTMAHVNDSAHLPFCYSLGQTVTLYFDSKKRPIW